MVNQEFLKKTYWSDNGKFMVLINKLQELIPAEGSVDKPRSTNRALEKFRKAQNCYYDLYNNGLCNRVSEFRSVFGISSSWYKLPYGYANYHEDMYVKVEEKFNEIILAAAIEQGFA